MDDRPIGSEIWTTNGFQRLNGGLAANAATGTHIEVAFEAAEIDTRMSGEGDGYLILSGDCDASDLAAISENAFREQKSDREFLIITGRAHGDGYVTFAEQNFQGFFHSQHIVAFQNRVTLHPP